MHVRFVPFFLWEKQETEAKLLSIQSHCSLGETFEISLRFLFPTCLSQSSFSYFHTSSRYCWHAAHTLRCVSFYGTCVCVWQASQCLSVLRLKVRQIYCLSSEWDFWHATLLFMKWVRTCAGEGVDRPTQAFFNPLFARKTFVKTSRVQLILSTGAWTDFVRVDRKWAVISLKSLWFYSSVCPVFTTAEQ